MARVVVGVGVPHNPFFPRLAMEDGQARIVGDFNTVRAALEAAEPDILLIYTSDHFVNFFYDKLPAFCVGTAEHADGPHEISRDMPWYSTKVAAAFGKGLLGHGLKSNFDLAGAEELRLDHSTLVPLHFLTPDMEIPIAPVFINGLAHPLPNADRCHQLGHMVRKYIEQWDDDARVGVIASGSISLEVGGPQVGWVDADWVNRVVELMRHGKSAELVAESTTEQLIRAGNASGELLNWIAMLGTLGDAQPTYLEASMEPAESPRSAHVFGVWGVVGG